MKTFLLALTLLCSLMSVAANAQSNAVKVDVPFSFVADGTALPSGAYEIRGMAGSDKFVRIENQQTGQVVLIQFRQIPLRSNNVHQHTKLIFMRQNNEFVLHQVRIAGDSHTHDIVHIDINEPATRPDV